MPAEVAINEAVVLAKRYASEDAARLVNGILGRIAAGGGRHERRTRALGRGRRSSLERLRARLDGAGAARGGRTTPTRRSTILAELAELAKEVEAEVAAGTREADAGA